MKRAVDIYIYRQTDTSTTDTTDRQTDRHMTLQTCTHKTERHTIQTDITHSHIIVQKHTHTHTHTDNTDVKILQTYRHCMQTVHTDRQTLQKNTHTDRY